MKYYFFRDLDHQKNLLDGRTYHASGIVDTVNEPSPSGKDFAVTFFEPFIGEITSEWRAVDEIEIFEVEEWEYEEAKSNYENPSQKYDSEFYSLYTPEDDQCVVVIEDIHGNKKTFDIDDFDRLMQTLHSINDY